MQLKRKNWKIIDQGAYLEVIPQDDDKEHFAGDECWCNPKVAQDDDMERPMISHNAIDGRE